MVAHHTFSDTARRYASRMPSLLQYHWVDTALINCGAGFWVENSPLVTAAQYSVLAGLGGEPQRRICSKTASEFSKCFFFRPIVRNHDLALVISITAPSELASFHRCMQPENSRFSVQSAIGFSLRLRRHAT